MPEVQLNITWPGDQPDTVYSPSTVIRNYFDAGDSITVEEFEMKITGALIAASNRVKERFGFECTSAMGELQRIKSIMANFPDRSGLVRIVSLD